MIYVPFRVRSKDYYFCKKWELQHPAKRRQFSDWRKAEAFITWFRYHSRNYRRALRMLLGYYRKSVKNLSDFDVVRALAHLVVRNQIQIWVHDRAAKQVVVGGKKTKKAKKAAVKKKDQVQRKTRTIRYQICGGEFTDIGIPNVPYVAERNGEEISKGKTDRNGDVTFEIGYGETVRIKIFNTTYKVWIDRSQKLPPIANVGNQANMKGFQKRLDILGYLTGYLRIPMGARQLTTGRDAPETQQALMNFMMDHGYLPDGQIKTLILEKADWAVGL